MLSDEQMSKGYPFSLLNDEQMSNKVRVEHQPDSTFKVVVGFDEFPFGIRLIFRGKLANDWVSLKIRAPKKIHQISVGSRVPKSSWEVKARNNSTYFGVLY